MEAGEKSTLILYDLALAIGGSLDMATVLHAALAACVRSLGGAAAIYLASPDVLPDEPAGAIPDAPAANAAVQVAGTLLPGPLTRSQWQNFCATLPQSGVDPAGGCYSLLPVGSRGLLVLAGGNALPPALLHALLPLMHKLDAAIGLCLEHEVLAAAHRTALLESNMLRTVLEATPTVLLAVDNEGRYIFSEGRMLEALGSQPGAVAGQSVFEIFGHAPELLGGIETALAGEPSRMTVQINERNWDVTYEPLVEESGLVSCVVGVAHDVTERTAAIDSLRAVLQTVGEGILSLDAAGLIALVNPELERIFGYGAEELLGEPIGLLLPEFTPDAPGALRFSESAASSPAFLPWRDYLGQRRELAGRRKDGTAFPVEVCINAIAAGEQAHYTGSLRDITERKEYDRLRDEFVSTVSHELRTPLASIMGWTETLLTEHPGPINDSQRRFLNIVYSSSQRLNRLIEEILTVSRIQRGTLRVNSELFEPAQLLATVRESAGPAAARQGIHLHVEDAWPAGTSVAGDPPLLEQVVNNLIGNALKFSVPGSDVFVRSLPVDGGWRLEVQDRGLGVRAADLPKLFQRFVRGSNAKEAHTQGAGLGLFVSKAIVEGHGGEIYLTSREGEGTTVWFDLPLRRPNGAKDLCYGE